MQADELHRNRDRCRGLVYLRPGLRTPDVSPRTSTAARLAAADDQVGGPVVPPTRAAVHLGLEHRTRMTTNARRDQRIARDGACGKPFLPSEDDRPRMARKETESCSWRVDRTRR